MDNNEKQKHANIKLALKVIGLMLIVVGLTFTIIGLADFFGSMDGEDMPDKFWCAFVGLPTLMVGISITTFGFKREIATYIKNESVPVINATGKEITPAISSITKTVKDAITDENGIMCECGTLNDKDSVFCKKCGKKLNVHTCPNCGEEVDADSEFCNKCGTHIDIR